MSRVHLTSRRRFIGQLSTAATAVALAPALRASKSLSRASGERPLGVALLGLGSYSTYQLGPALRETKWCRLTAVITGTPAKGRRWLKEHDLPPGSAYNYDTMERIADNPEIDIVYVVTPPGTHRDFVLRAARAHKHVICEKPMAPSVQECDEMIAACRAAGRKLGIGYRLEYDPYHVEMERFVRDPKFGQLQRMSGAHAFRVGGRSWRVDKSLAGGGPLPDVGIYVIQAACRAAGDIAPIAVTAQEGKKERPELFSDVEESMRWTMEFPSGAICEGFTSYNANGNRFRAESAKEWVELSPAFSYNGLRGRTSRGEIEFAPFNQQAAQMDDFARCILENRETPVPGEMGRRDVAIMEAIYRAAATGERVTL